MGLKESSSAVYLGIYEGKFVRRFKTPVEGSIERINKENRVVYEKFYKAIEGRIVGIDTKPSKEYGERLLVYVSDDTIYCIEMKLDSRYAVNFLKTLPNVKLNEPVEIIPSKKTTDGKDDYTVFLKQNNTTLKRFYTKDNPDGIPEPTLKKGKRGKPDEWDFSEVNDFLYESVVVPFRDNLRAVNKISIPASHEAIPGDLDTDVIPGSSDIGDN